MLGKVHRNPQPESQSERAFLSAGRAIAPESQSDRVSLRTAGHVQNRTLKIKNIASLDQLNNIDIFQVFTRIWCIRM